MKIIRLIIISILFISLSSCEKETIISSATINGYPYAEKVKNNFMGPTPCGFMVFYDTLGYGVYGTILSPVDCNLPTYYIGVYVQGNGDNFAAGKTLKLGSSHNVLQLLNSATTNFEIEDNNHYIPEGYDGVAFCGEVNGSECENVRELSGILEICSYDSTVDIFYCKFILKNDDNPSLTINSGYMKITISHIR